jgi:hypothetical protein
VVFVTAAGAVAQCLTGTQFGLVDWTDSIAGGELVRFDSGGGHSAWTSTAWQIEAGHDLALNLSFSGPRAAVQNGGAASAPYLTHLQATPVDFGAVVAPATVQRTFRVTHRGTFPLLHPNLRLPVGYSLIAPSSLPAIVDPGSSFTITISLSTQTRGIYAGNIALDAGDAAEPLFEFPVTGRVMVPELSLTISDPACPGGESGAVFSPPSGGTLTRLWFNITNTGDGPLDVSPTLFPP